MKVCRKTIILKNIMIFFMITVILLNLNQIIISTSAQVNFRRTVKVGVLVHSFTPYMTSIRQNLEEIQKENNGKVEFTFWDSKDNEAIQNEGINNLLQQKNVDLLLLNLVNTKKNMVETVINTIKVKNIPVVLFFYTELAEMKPVKEYEKAFVVGTDSKQAGTLEGQILVDLWNNDKAAIDKNNDNIMQYVMLKGANSEETDDRTNYSILAINNAGIKTEELQSVNGNWDREIAKSAMESLLLRYNNKIEAIIANSSGMAIGAIEALQKYGYNKGDKNKNIAVVGIDVIPEVTELIKKGFMTGTVYEDSSAEAKALYTIGMNLYYNRSPIDGTDYKLENDKKMILIPFQPYKV